MSFQTVLSIVGMIFTAIELYQRFRQKDSSGGEAAFQSPISPITTASRAEPKQSGAGRSGAESKYRNGLIIIHFVQPLKCRNKINW